MTISWPFSRQQVLDDSGRPLLIPRVNFYAGGTTNPITVFKDAGRTQPWTQPVEADGFGRFPRVYLPDGLYREEVLGPYGDLLWNDDGLGEPVVTDTTDPTPTIDPTALPGTGDTKWRMDASIQPGWVRMNARTIGAANSGATELGDTSAKALFRYLWTTFPDGIAAVIGGRGTTADADFSAGKPITIPTMQGLVAAGLDDMGSTPANRIQVSGQIALTAGSNIANVDNAARIALGMTIVAAGVPANTFVTGVSGNTITMSNPAGAGSTGTVSARLSIFADAQLPGQIGADSIEGLVNGNLPVTLPSGTGSYDPPADNDVVYSSLQTLRYGDGGTASTTSFVWVGTAPRIFDPGASPISVAISNPGGGVPITTLQPSRLGTWYMKL